MFLNSIKFIFTFSVLCFSFVLCLDFETQLDPLAERSDKKIQANSNTEFNTTKLVYLYLTFSLYGTFLLKKCNITL